MAKLAPTTDETRWTSAQFNYAVAEMAWSAVDLADDCPARESVAQTVADARSSLLSVPAPDLGAVTEKLSLWWGEDLYDDSYESMQNRGVIGDLRRIERLNAGMEEAEASGRSDEQATDLAEAWRAAFTELGELENLFMAGDEAVTWHQVANAEGVLLGLPAPTIAGVVRKLELLWELDRFGSVEAAAFSYHVICDLNRLSRYTEETFEPQ